MLRISFLYIFSLNYIYYLIIYKNSKIYIFKRIRQNMKRKAIQLANQTLVISLPSKWVKQQGIKKGDEIEVTEEENRLIIGEPKKQEHKKIEIDIINYSISMLYRHLRALYREGYDELILKFKNIAQLNEIEEVINNLISFEIVEQINNKCIIKDISVSQTKDINELIKRVFIIIISMCEELQNSIKDLEINKLKEIIKIDTQINRLTDYILRLINKNIIKEQMKTRLLYFITMQLEYIGDNFKIIAKKTIESNLKRFDMITIKLLNEAYNSINLFYLNFYKPDESLIKEANDIKESINLIYRDINKSKISKNEIEICDIIKHNIYMIIDTLDEVRVAL